jgi:chromosome segregation ATPase
MALMRLVQAEAAERQSIAAEATDIQLGTMMQRLLTERDVQASMAAAGSAQRDAELSEAHLASEELEGRLAAMEAEQSALAQQQQEQLARTQMLADHAAQHQALEQQESLGRLEIASEQSGSLAELAGRLASVAGRLAEAQAAAQASRERVASLEEALEEREVTLSRLGRELEAVRDAQVAPDVGAQQRELGRSEGEERETIASEQRAAWSTLQEVTRASHASEMRLARTSPAHPSFRPSPPHSIYLPIV